MVIVYSVVDVTSLKIAEDILQYLWKTGSATDKATILVGNKSDLVRTRVVPIVGKDNQMGSPSVLSGPKISKAYFEASNSIMFGPVSNEKSDNIVYFWGLWV